MNIKQHHQFISGILILLALAVGYNYWRYMIKQEYWLSDFVECNPQKESCFVNNYDDGETYPSYFKVVEKRAFSLKNCDTIESNCEPFSCQKGDKYCRVFYCDKNNKQSPYPYDCDQINP